VSELPQKVCNWLSEELGWIDPTFTGALSGGNSNLTWRFDAENNACVVRTPPTEAISPNSGRGIEREAKVLAAVEGRAKAPRLFAYCDDLAVIGRAFLGSRMYRRRVHNGYLAAGIC